MISLSKIATLYILQDDSPDEVRTSLGAKSPYKKKGGEKE